MGDRDSGIDFMRFEVTCSGLRVQGLALSADEFEGSWLMVESTHRLHGSSFWELPYRILTISTKPNYNGAYGQSLGLGGIRSRALVGWAWLRALLLVGMAIAGFLL